MHPGANRHALRARFAIEETFNLTKIDRWFLVQLKETMDHFQGLAGARIERCPFLRSTRQLPPWESRCSLARPPRFFAGHSTG
jgi:hypothetical protein